MSTMGFFRRKKGEWMESLSEKKIISKNFSNQREKKNIQIQETQELQLGWTQRDTNQDTLKLLVKSDLILKAPRVT